MMVFILIKFFHFLTIISLLFTMSLIIELFIQFILLRGIILKKIIRIIITVILSVLLCACLFYNLVAGAPQEYGAAIRYMICAAGFSIIVSGLSGYSIFKIFSFKVAENENVRETRNIPDQSYRGSFTELVNALDKTELSNDDIDKLRCFLNNLEEPDTEE